MTIRSIPTSPIEGQKTGTSGLRKKVALVEATPNYIENWVQSLMTALAGSQKGSTFVLGGDGRYLNDKAMLASVGILAANGVSHIIIGQHGLMSTPAVSNLIRKRKAFGGIIMTASHNPAGPHGDWGIKFNCSNGEPAPERITDSIYTETQRISEIKYVDLSLTNSSLATVGSSTVHGVTIEVVDPVSDYVELLKSIFDFPKIRQFLSMNPDIVFDGMHAITGIYAKRVFVDEFKLPASVLINSTPSPDFNGGHPDPNLAYATDLVARMMKDNGPMFGAASDGDGDRNMIMGRNWFVTPSDSLAVIADYAVDAIPYFARNGLKGVARSMPTSRAVDAVAAAKGFSCFQTPTGWKYFGNLMDAGMASLCGEESFGTGADHVREKDGLWAVLAWLSVLEYVNRDNKGPISGVQEINERHWDKYGRHVYCRCDYEEVSADGAKAMISHIRRQLDELAHSELQPGWIVQTAEEYAYTDPVDGSVATNQGIIVSFTNGSRVVYRLSGTGSAGATVRVYKEQFVKEWRSSTDDSLDKGPLMKIHLELSNIQEFTGRTEPTVIT